MFGIKNHLRQTTPGSAHAIRKCFVPAAKTITDLDIEKLQKFFDSSTRLAVLTGAGISTESGLPDYRSEGVGLYARSSYRPMTFGEFLKSHTARQRYWARSFLGWNFIFNRKPNIGHLTLTEWQRRGKLFCLITQNVDRLHHKAGTESVIELHGNLYNVKCLQCDNRISRITFQNQLARLNETLLKQEWIQDRLSAKDDSKRALRPDGDVDLGEEYHRSFQIPYCDGCGGILKPDTVFFGENVPAQKVAEIYELINQSDSLLVIGSSLMVFSSFRFALHCHQHRKPVAIVNIGSTRADNLNVLKLETKISDIIPKIKL